MLRPLGALLAASLLAAPAFAAPKEERSLEERLDALETEVREQRAELRRLRKKVRRAEKKAVHARETRVSLSGYAQVDATPYRASSRDEIDPSTGEPQNEVGFALRRARLRAAIAHHVVHGYVELDGNTVDGPTARVAAGELRVQWPPPDEESRWGLSAALGLMKIPFGYEVPEENLAQLFLERSTAAEALFPGNYDLGVALRGRYAGIELTLAAMNGAPSGEQQFEARDPASSLELLGRLAAEVEPLAWLRLEGGVSTLFGQGLSPGTPPTKDTLVWRDANENGLVESTEIQAIAGSAGTAAELFERFAIGGHARVGFDVPWLGALVLFGELVYAKNLDRALYVADPVLRSRDIRELGWSIGGRQELTEYAEIGVRYDRYQPDFDAAEQQGKELVPLDTSLGTIAAAAAGRYGPARLILEYDHRTNSLGRTYEGAPTTRRDDSFVIRGEVRF
jgi:hypothetical protein